MSDVRCGFSLIELMVVVSLFGIAASLVTASYLSFEKNNRVKSAATSLKSDIRLIQNKAASGDKGTPGGSCTAAYTLGGWYLLIAAEEISYSYGGICQIAATNDELAFDQKQVKLPKDIRISAITYNSGSQNVTYPFVIFFMPVKFGPTYHHGSIVLPSGFPPDFFADDGTGVLDSTSYVNPQPADPVVITLSSTDGSRQYQVRMESTGEVNEVKP